MTKRARKLKTQFDSNPDFPDTLRVIVATPGRTRWSESVRVCKGEVAEIRRRLKDYPALLKAAQRVSAVSQMRGFELVGHGTGVKMADAIVALAVEIEKAE